MDPFNYYNFIPTELSSAIIVFNILFAFVVALVVVWVYRYTHRGLSYSQSFLVTIVMVTMLGAVVMMVVQGNLIGAFALLGAFSLIRFRTIIKDTKDVAFVFFGLVEGVASGTSNYTIAIFSLVLVSGALILFYRWKGGVAIKEGYILLLNTSQGFSQEKLNSLLGNFSDSYHMLHIKSAGDQTDYSFALLFKSEKKPDSLIQDLKVMSGVNSVDLMTGKEAVEY